MEALHVGRDGVADWMVPSAGDASWADGADEVVVDGAGRAWIHGYAGSPLTLGGKTLIGDFILALDAGGGVRWTRQLESYAYDRARLGDGTVVVIEKEAGLVEVVLDGESGELVSRRPLFEGDDVERWSAPTEVLDPFADTWASPPCGRISRVPSSWPSLRPAGGRGGLRGRRAPRFRHRAGGRRGGVQRVR